MRRTKKVDSHFSWHSGWKTLSAIKASRDDESRTSCLALCKRLQRVRDAKLDLMVP